MLRKSLRLNVPEALEHGMHSAEYTAVGIALAGLAVGVVLFAFAYGAVKAFAKTSFGCGSCKYLP